MFNREINMNAWTIPTLNLKAELCCQDERFVDKPYTILDQSHVFRDAQTLKLFLKIYPQLRTNDIVKLVAFKPERIALHQLIIAINLKVKVSNDLQLIGLVHELFEKIEKEPQFISLMKECYQIRDNLHSTIETLLTEDCYQSGIFEKLSIPSLKERLQKISADVSGAKLNQNINLLMNEKEVVTALVLDEIYTTIVTNKINKFINEILNNMLEHNPDLALTLHEANKRIVVMISGGQASGKSAVIDLLKSDLSNHQITFEDFVKLNADNFKPLLLKPGSVNKFLYSQLVQPEASWVRVQLQKQIEELMHARYAPNLYIDQVFIGHHKLNFLLPKQAISAFIISTKIEDAIERSFSRGAIVANNQGRFEHTEGILTGHKGVAEHFFAHIFQYIGQNLVFTLFDNNSEKQLPTAAMRLHMQANRLSLTIFDESKFKLFIKKLTINIQAKNINNIYVENSDLLTENFYQNFIEKLHANGFKVHKKNYANQLAKQWLFKHHENSKDEYKTQGQLCLKK